MCIKFKRILIVLLFLFIVVPANAGIVTITDDFDNSDKTADLWDASFGGSWDHIELTGPDLGYHGVANSESSGTAAFVANQQYFDIANLSMKTLVKIDGSDTDRKDVVAGFLFISGTITTGHYDEYTIILNIDYDDDPNILAPVRRLEVWHNNVTPSGETNTLMGADQATITLNTFYSLQLSTNSQGQINVNLYDLNDLQNPLASLSDITHTPFASGMVGIVASPEATFNDFSLTGFKLESYQYSVDYFSLDGNLPGSIVDNFDDGVLWPVVNGTAIESNGVVTLSEPGRVETELSDKYFVTIQESEIYTSNNSFQIQNGGGNFVAQSKWLQPVPSLNHIVSMSLVLTDVSGEKIEEFEVGIMNPGPLSKDHFKIPAGMGVYFCYEDNSGNFKIHGIPIEQDITGDVIFGIHFDDKNDQFSGSYSLDGDFPPAIRIGPPLPSRISEANFCHWSLEAFVADIQQICQGDFDGDGDVDGEDLAAFITGNHNVLLIEFSTQFGQTNCR